MLRISVVIPTYNSERYLERCLRSIERQQYPNLEVILVDGRSTDGTAEIVSKFQHLVTKFISEPDGGQSDAVTKGLRLATGDICHWHASDDVVTPGAFGLVAAEFQKHPDVDLIFSDGWAFDEHRLYMTGPCRGLSFWDALLFEGRFQSDSAYWRRPITTNGMPLDNSMPLTCDEDFFLRIWAGHRARWVNRQLGAFCVRPDQTSQTLNRGEVPRLRVASRRRVAANLGISPLRWRLLQTMHFPHYVLMKGAREGERGARRLVRTLTGDAARRRDEYAFFNQWLNS